MSIFSVDASLFQETWTFYLYFMLLFTIRTAVQPFNSVSPVNFNNIQIYCIAMSKSYLSFRIFKLQMRQQDLSNVKWSAPTLV